jgi:hypothetical protein
VIDAGWRPQQATHNPAGGREFHGSSWEWLLS